MAAQTAVRVAIGWHLFLMFAGCYALCRRQLAALRAGAPKSRYTFAIVAMVVYHWSGAFWVIPRVARALEGL